MAEPGKWGRAGDPLAPYPHPPSLLSGIQERVVAIPGYHTPTELWGSSEVLSKNVDLAEAELPSET